MIAVLHLRLLHACIYDYCTINEYYKTINVSDYFI